jgi:hypothetical protein
MVDRPTLEVDCCLGEPFLEGFDSYLGIKSIDEKLYEFL